ncbi:putative glycosyl transferase [Frankia canadensis]|uniref:Putative glycosyl transferase n=1 Tax=Frankia canadensis TaxID=1836972 RepID=A0A2I2KP27_9ACTN|nr:glycosyltransferase family 4 protein [Frankia canadensis]SNQ47399.1 putative glycosyl transferase [Frankia canadensis]SOU54689.1 putative glycosyl transferase [Frankia canadensis]
MSHPPSRRRVLVLTHYFPPEIGAPQARLSETARAWASAGLHVTVLTGLPNHPTGVIPPAYRGAWLRTERVDGYRVLRTWLYATPNEGVVRRTLSHLSFMVTSVTLGGWRTGPCDVVMVSSPTFFPLGSAWLLARLRRARLIVEVRDLWPAIFEQLGVLTDRRVLGVLERLELAAYRAADAVVTVTEGFRDDIVRRGIPAGKVHVIRNGVDLTRFRPGTRPPAGIRARLGAGDGEILVLYIGAHGISHGLTSIADAAARLAAPQPTSPTATSPTATGRNTADRNTAGMTSEAPTSQPVRFAFVGEGAQKRRLADHVRGLGLTNTVLHDGVPREQVPGVVAAADICVVPLRDVPMFDTFIPSKMFELLAAGRPVIGTVRGEAARILMAAGQAVVPPEDPDALAREVARLAADPDRRARMARDGRAYVERHFDRDALARDYQDLLFAPPIPPPPTPTAEHGDPPRSHPAPVGGVPAQRGLLGGGTSHRTPADAGTGAAGPEANA